MRTSTEMKVFTVEEAAVSREDGNLCGSYQAGMCADVDTWMSTHGCRQIKGLLETGCRRVAGELTPALPRCGTLQKHIQEITPQAETTQDKPHTTPQRTPTTRHNYYLPNQNGKSTSYRCSLRKTRQPRTYRLRVGTAYTNRSTYDAERSQHQHSPDPGNSSARELGGTQLVRKWIVRPSSTTRNPTFLWPLPGNILLQRRHAYGLSPVTSCCSAFIVLTCSHSSLRTCDARQPRKNGIIQQCVCGGGCSFAAGLRSGSIIVGDGRAPLSNGQPFRSRSLYFEARHQRCYRDRWRGQGARETCRIALCLVVPDTQAIELVAIRSSRTR